MPPKPVKKKFGKPTEKKVTKTVSIPQIDLDNEFDDDQVFAEDIPVDQLDLPEEDLTKDVTIILRAENPYFSEEFVEFSFKDLEYKSLSNFPDTVTFFSQRGNMVHKTLVAHEDDAEGGIKEEKRKNKFNFCDRAIQTMSLPLRNQIVQTKIPARAKLNHNSSLWGISAMCELREKLSEEEFLQISNVDRMFRIYAKNEGFDKSVKYIDRMINQNQHFEVLIDFSYYDNPCDEFLEQGMGSLLPLWKFSFRKMKGMNVTSICWNYHYTDMFAAAFGTSEFLYEKKGCICIFSLKCTDYSEIVYDSDSSVQCMDFSKFWPYLLAAGFADGSVAVYDLRSEKATAAATSECCRLEHNDMITQVKWLADDVDDLKNFCSVSSDGRVINWCLTKGELVPKEIVNLKNKGCEADGTEGTVMDAISCASTISFNKDSLDLFLVGTSEGLIQKCSGLYSEMCLSTCDEHENVVYNVEWNPFHPRVFLSCSADWTIKIWDHTNQEAVFMFDMFNEVKTATWAPFSSTLFAAITKDGKVHVFDLVMNRNQPTCSLLVHGPKKHTILTSVSFNPKLPVLLVGDERGYIMSFKLSPNLRSSLKGLTLLEKSKFVASEIDKMEKVLKLVENPQARTAPTS